jgi:hypothetical protein
MKSLRMVDYVLTTSSSPLKLPKVRDLLFMIKEFNPTLHHKRKEFAVDFTLGEFAIPVLDTFFQKCRCAPLAAILVSRDLSDPVAFQDFGELPHTGSWIKRRLHDPDAILDNSLAVSMAARKSHGITTATRWVTESKVRSACNSWQFKPKCPQNGGLRQRDAEICL